MAKFYLYNTTDETYLEHQSVPFRDYFGFSDLCIDDAFNKSLQIAQIKYIKDTDSSKSLLHISNTAHKGKGYLNIDDNMRGSVFGQNTESLLATEGNPVVAVLTKKVRLIHEYPCYVRFAVVGDCIFLILLSGLLYIEDENGNEFPMRRSVLKKEYDNYLSESVTLTVEDFKRFGLVKDPVTEVPMASLGIMDATLEVDVNKDKYAMSVIPSVNISALNSIIFSLDKYNELVRKKHKQKNRVSRNTGLKNKFEEEDFEDIQDELDNFDLDLDDEQDDFMDTELDEYLADFE